VGYSIQVQGNLVAGISGYGRIIAQAGKVHGVGSIAWGAAPNSLCAADNFCHGRGEYIFIWAQHDDSGPQLSEELVGKDGGIYGGLQNGGQLAGINK